VRVPEDWGLTDAGYVAPRAADFLSVIRDEYEADTGLTMDWRAEDPLGALTANMAARLGELGEASQAVYDAFNPNNATGIHLDDIGLIRGVPRSPATYSQATVTLTGTAGTVIPEGKIVEGGGSDGRARWRTTEDVTIGGGGTVDVIVRAEEIGRVVATVGQIDAIVTPEEGWTSVTNAADATPGDDIESDSDYRARQQESLQIGGGRTRNTLVAELLALDGVTAAVVLENDTIAPVTVAGVNLDPISVCVVVAPDTLTTDQQKEVARVIFDQLPVGTAMVGSDVEATIEILSGQTYTVVFDFAADLNVTVAIEVELDSGYDLEDVEETIQEAVQEYFDGLGVGDAVRLLAILGIIDDVEGVVAATVELNGSAADVVPTVIQRPVVSGAITVTEAP
jgi:uncharacterized phage protein gp47/JayE